MINASGELMSTDILARLRGGNGHETTDFSVCALSDSVTKSNICTCLLPTIIIEPSSKSKGFKSLVLPSL